MSRRRILVALAGAVVSAASLAAPSVAAPRATLSVGPVSVISGTCNGQSAEVQEAVDPTTGSLYALWMGCKGITFAADVAGSSGWSTPQVVPNGGGGTSTVWDPTIAVAPDGAVYTAFIRNNGSQYYPVVDASFNDGQSFTQSTSLTPPQQKNWGDRPFIAVGPTSNEVVVTWDYGPSRSSITYLCPKGGSCAFASGDLNVVAQVSMDGGRTFSKIVPINPGFPAGGGDAAPVVIEPDGRIDVAYQDFPVTNPTTDALAPATNEFSYSTDHGQTWSSPVPIDPAAGTMALAEWWIEPSLGLDAAGNLYVAWDTQAANTDVAYMADSTDHGATWNLNIASSDGADVPHITQVVGGAAGQAYVGWLSAVNASGYALYLRPFSLTGGWTAAAQRVSTVYGNPGVWPGDTFGMATLGTSRLALTWGGTLGASATRSVISAATVTLG